MDLAFEDTELVAEGENLDLERGFGLPAEEKEVEQGADEEAPPPRPELTIVQRGPEWFRLRLSQSHRDMVHG